MDKQRSISGRKFSRYHHGDKIRFEILTGDAHIEQETLAPILLPFSNVITLLKSLKKGREHKTGRKQGEGKPK